MNKTAHYNTSEGTELLAKVDARCNALLSKQKTTQLVADLCAGTHLKDLAKQYFDTHVPGMFESKTAPLVESFNTGISGREEFEAAM